MQKLRQLSFLTLCDNRLQVQLSLLRKFNLRPALASSSPQKRNRLTQIHHPTNSGADGAPRVAL